MTNVKVDTKVTNTEEVISLVTPELVNLRADVKKAPQRFGKTRNGALRSQAGGCMYGFAEMFHNTPKTEYVYVAYHGAGPEFGWEEIVNPKAYSDFMKKPVRPWNKFESTEQSLEWVKYLQSETSPWGRLHPFMLVTDPVEIDKSGWIFKRDGVDGKLLYNFLMAIRYPWEQAKQFQTFRLLKSHGLEENLSCFISNLFVLRDYAKDIQGPWDVVYPMSYLEQATLEAAGRFISASPACGHKKDSKIQESNVKTLWNCPDPGKYVTQCLEMSEKDLTLSEIVDVVQVCVASQIAQITAEKKAA